MIQLDLLLKCHGQTTTYKYFNEQSKTADCDFNLSTCRYHYPYPIKDFQVFDFTWAYNMQSSHILRGHWCLNVVALPCPSIKVDKGWRMFHEIDANKLFFNEFLNIWFVSRKKSLSSEIPGTSWKGFFRYLCALGIERNNVSIE